MGWSKTSAQGISVLALWARSYPVIRSLSAVAIVAAGSKLAFTQAGTLADGHSQPAPASGCLNGYTLGSAGPAALPGVNPQVSATGRIRTRDPLLRRLPVRVRSAG